MRPFTKADLTALLAEQSGPCVSLYLTTPRSYPDNQQGKLYRNLLDQASAALRDKVPAAKAQALLEPFHGLAGDNAFWTLRTTGLAVFGSADGFHAFDLERPVPDRAVVAHSFHVKPLLRIVQSADRYHVLCLQRESVRLFEGNRDGLHPIEPAGVPLTVEVALGPGVGVNVGGEVYDHRAEGTAPTDPGRKAPPGHNAKGDDAKMDSERFFRVVDRAVWEHVSRPTDLPLVVVALPEQQTIFRNASHIES